jgi:hypothetical protein
MVDVPTAVAEEQPPMVVTVEAEQPEIDGWEAWFLNLPVDPGNPDGPKVGDRRPTS